MQSLNDERNQVLGEVLSDELEAILEYVKDVPKISQEIRQVHATVSGISDRLSVIEQVVKGHEIDARHLKSKTA